MKYIIVLAASLILLVSCGKKKQVTAASDIFYTCSMHPQVIQNKPGNCPICGMQLIQVNNSTTAKSDEIKLSAEQIELGNIHADTISKSSIGDRLVLTATLNFDQMKATSVSSRVMGRVERLYYKNLGDFVKKGVPLFDLYSEELNNAKQEFLLALDKRKAFTSETVIDFDQLIQSARNKLLLWGLSEQQISELEKNKKAAPVTTFYSSASGYITQMEIREGDFVMEGGTIVKLADLSTLWAEAQVYTSQMAGINANSIVTVQLSDFENKEITGKIDFVNPEINPDTRINLIRVSIPNPGNQLKPGMPAYVILKSPKQQSLTLPIDAVIRDGKGATVWLQTGSNSFKSVMVETGLEADDRIEIKSGLKEGDVVVISGAYLLHSEFIFKKGANPMDGMKM
ncbi:MAG TPA: efflux RND transporter periplasmic adaptor subunit [Chitinophagaceae bacterium]|jgi:Cu(I)/Ag(I) efflux system membrane fusion protein|nr:efflux RND transporter periplasmic adaptor subunit [Chitinophagaceae bacterium]HMU59042.1 efflux RND transporter periplasmic adaptor subunit [Chitinophagaceae bacterium]